MNNLVERIQQIRKYFKMSQEKFAAAIGQSQPNISKMEGGVFEPTETTINAIIARFPVNPEWLKNGNGEMLISSKNYLQNGMAFLGREEMIEGIASILRSDDYQDLKARVGLDGLAESGLPEEIAPYLRYIVQTWQHGDEKTRNWLEKQLELAFQGVKGEL